MAYTFDAGPNPCLYLLEKDVPQILSLVKYIFPPKDDNATFIRGYKSPFCNISEVCTLKIFLKNYMYI